VVSVVGNRRRDERARVAEDHELTSGPAKAFSQDVVVIAGDVRSASDDRAYPGRWPRTRHLGADPATHVRHRHGHLFLRQSIDEPMQLLAVNAHQGRIRLSQPRQLDPLTSVADMIGRCLGADGVWRQRVAACMLS